jgi:hypothetical protein
MTFKEGAEGEGRSHRGPLLFPSGPPASRLHDALDRVETSVIHRRPELIEYVPERTDRPWLGDEWGDARWFPKPPAEAASTPS